MFEGIVLSLLVRCKAMFTMSGPGLGVVKGGAIYVEEGRIVAVGDDRDVMRSSSKGDYYYDLRGKGVVLPGFIDAHMHTPLTIVRGFCQDVPEIEWMRRTVSPLMRSAEYKHLLAGSRLGVLEALRSGTTTFGDYTGISESLARDIYLKYGLRGVLTHTINSLASSIDRVGEGELYPFDLERGYSEYESARELFFKYHSPPSLSVMMGPQALDMVPLSLIKEIYSFALEKGIMVHMHIAQGGRERIQIKKRYGDSTVNVLYREGLLNPSLLAAHCHDASDDELRLLASEGVSMVSCQRSIAMIDGVVPPLIKYLGYGGRSALGTDQASGNNNQSLFSELKFVSILNKVLARDPSVLPAWKVLRLATIEGAMAIGMDRFVGSLEVGKRGDIVVVDLDRYNLTPVLDYPIRNYVFNLIYSSFGNEVAHVFIDGVPMVVDGRVVAMDEEAIVKEAQDMAEDLVKRAGEDYLGMDSYIVRGFREGLY
jgi:5-methylthioadenosine/S-adenosylhomocysteine deaminase